MEVASDSRQRTIRRGDVVHQRFAAAQRRDEKPDLFQQRQGATRLDTQQASHGPSLQRRGVESVFVSSRSNRLARLRVSPGQHAATQRRWRVTGQRKRALVRRDEPVVAFSIGTF